MPASGLTLEQCQQYFHLPVAQAALRLHVSRPTISKVLRRHGITRWPFRKLQAQARNPRPRLSRASESPSNRIIHRPFVQAARLRQSLARNLTSSNLRRSAVPHHCRRPNPCSRSAQSMRPVSVSPPKSHTASAGNSKLNASVSPQPLPSPHQSPSRRPFSPLIITTPPCSPSTQSRDRTAAAHLDHSLIPSSSALRHAAPQSPHPTCPSSPSQTPLQTPPQTPRCASPVLNASAALWPQCELWGPPRPSSAKAVFGDSWTRGVFADSAEGSHFQFLAPGERVCTPKLSQSADKQKEMFENFGDDHQEDHFMLSFGDIYDEVYDPEVLGFH
ncbi:unnamed protein product [Agarophyton chilense]|eukprot:gb/GEZJ01006727.1/.p1 GENE.gb/GEZJ01006727.1/~~gb/GEZJ01006727.1/.p1  ORF type:complete len:378 (-),score=29.04 gb/GEZJ01006727.1/:103-1095(-)